MKKNIFVFMMVTALFLCSACGGNGGSVVKKTAKTQENFKPEEIALKETNDFTKDGVSASVTGISYEEVVTKINVHVKNDTEENLRVMSANVSVNGMMTTAYLDCEAPAKSEKDSFIELGNDWLGNMEIKKITDVEFMIKVYNEQNDEIMQSEVIRVTTDAPSFYKQKYDDSGFAVYNEGGIKLLARALQINDLSGDTELVFYAENNTDSAVVIMAQDVVANGKPVQPLFVITVDPGKKAVDTMVFYKTDLEANEIAEINELSASFKAFNNDLETIFETDVLNVPIG